MGTLGGAVGRGGGTGDQDIRRHAVATLSAFNQSAGTSFAECEHVKGCMKFLAMRLDNGHPMGTFLKVCIDNPFHFNLLIVE